MSKEDKEGRKKQKKGAALPYVIFRILLSMTMLGVFGFGLYQAFAYFSGTTPITDPRKLVLTLVTSEESAKFLSTIFGMKLPKSLSDLQNSLKGVQPEPSEGVGGTEEVVFKFAIIADTHNNNTDLIRALSQIKQLGAKIVVGLGDYSDVGTVEELKKAKEIFVSNSLPFYTTAGDHDLWDARDKGLNSLDNFTEVFGSAYQSFENSGIRFIIINNSDNDSGIDDLQFMWLEEELARINVDPPKKIFVFLHEGLYHPSSDHVMGKTNPRVKAQAEKVISLLREAQVAEVFAGDAHFYGRFQEPNTLLSMTSIGAISKERNTQTPRFAMVEIFASGSYNVSDVEVK